VNPQKTGVEELKQGIEFLYGLNKQQVSHVRAKECFKEATLHGNPAGASFLAMVYWIGNDGTHARPGEATRLCKMAIKMGITEASANNDSGDVHCQCGLGWMFDVGCGVEKDISKSLALLTMSAEQGNSIAQLLLGETYDHEGCHKEAFRWFLKSAVQGNAKAQYQVGYMLLLHDIVMFLDESIKWFIKSAIQGNPGGQHQLAKVLRDYGDGGKEHLPWMMKSANQGHCGAQLELGLMFIYGGGVKQSDEDGVMWLIKSGNQGETGLLTRDILDVLFKDDDRDKKRLHIAACEPNNYILAQYNIGRGKIIKSNKNFFFYY
jgi:TPR repeat protein